MFCPKCGKDIKDGSKFCKHCGSEIKKNKNGTSVPNKVDNAQSGGDEKTKKIIIGVLVAAIVILAIVFVAFGTGLFNGNSHNTNTNSNAQPQANVSSSKPVSLSSFPVSEAPALAQAAPCHW